MGRRPFPCAGFGPALCQPLPPPSRGAARKIQGFPRTEDKRKHVLDSGRDTRSEAGASTDGRNRNRLHPGSNAPGNAPVFHLPWSKARIRPVDDGGRSGTGQRERKAGRGVEAGMRESREGMRASGGRGRDGESRGKSMRNGVNHAARNSERGAERKGTLPGSLPANCYRSLDGRVFINGRVFQTCVSTGRPPPVKQKPSEALGLISGARRLRGSARVGSEEWAGGRSWGGDERTGSMYGPAGGRSVSRGSQRDLGVAGRRDGGNSESGVWWVRGKPHPTNDLDTGSRTSSSEFSASVESSINSPVRPEGAESGSEMEKHEWETVEEETATGSEGEIGGRESVAGGNGVNGDSRKSSAQLSQETDAHREAAPHRPRAPRSSQEAMEEGAAEDEEVRNVLSLTLAGQPSSSKQLDTSPGVTKDLSPIIEATEEEEEDKGRDEKSRGFGESAV